MHQETRGLQSRLHHSTTNDNDTSAFRREINDSISLVSRDPFTVDSVLMEHETQRLGGIHEPPTRYRSPTRRNISPSIAWCSMRAAAAAATSSSPSQFGSQSPSMRARSSRPRY